ncbi:MAG TPA: hypothetical protein VHU40_13290, partial [Polyangia bacterium]|nr:hypothetical protein [Polyangia bacterium]
MGRCSCSRAVASVAGESGLAATTSTPAARKVAAAPANAASWARQLGQLVARKKSSTVGLPRSDASGTACPRSSVSTNDGNGVPTGISRGEAGNAENARFDEPKRISVAPPANKPIASSQAIRFRRMNSSCHRRPSTTSGLRR